LYQHLFQFIAEAFIILLALHLSGAEKLEQTPPELAGLSVAELVEQRRELAERIVALTQSPFPVQDINTILEGQYYSQSMDNHSTATCVHTTADGNSQVTEQLRRKHQQYCGKCKKCKLLNGLNLLNTRTFVLNCEYSFQLQMLTSRAQFLKPSQRGKQRVLLEPASDAPIKIAASSICLVLG
jgi:hypothetical protein